MLFLYDSIILNIATHFE